MNGREAPESGLRPKASVARLGATLAEAALASSLRPSHTSGSAARLATERRACIPGRRVSSVQHGNAAMPKPINDIASAFLASPPRAFAGMP
jgi:hypothetical protein